MEVEDWPEKEFLGLLEQYWILLKTLEEKRILSAEKLIKARNHIENCDYLVGNSRRRIHLLYITFNYWNECLAKWSLNTPPGEENEGIPALKLKTGRTTQSTRIEVEIDSKENLDRQEIYDENLDNNDRRFLRSLKIDSGIDPKKIKDLLNLLDILRKILKNKTAKIN